MPTKQPIEGQIMQGPVEQRRTIESKPVDLNILLYLLVAVGVAILLIMGGGYLLIELIRTQFGDEGVRMMMLLVGVMLLYVLINWTQSKVRRDNLHDLTEVQRVAVQAIIQHQRADDEGEVSRMMPQVIKVLAQNQERGHRLASEITRHGRWLATEESKSARNAKPVLPFGIDDDDEDMEEII